MRVLSLFLLSTLCASDALARSTGGSSSSSRRLEERVRRRTQLAAGNTHSSQPLIPATNVTKYHEAAIAGAAVQYTNNWSGAVLTSPPSGTTFKSVTGRAVVPAVKKPAGGTGSSWSGCAWVGIDGDSYQGAILQTGFDFTYLSTGEQTYHLWYEWFPSTAADFPNIAVSAGDTIEMTVNATSTSSGTATVNNLTTGKSASISLKAPSSTAVLEGVNAEWIVEAYSYNGALVILPDFGTITISDAVATTASGVELGPDAAGATVVEQYQGSRSNVVTSATNGKGFTAVTYV